MASQELGFDRSGGPDCGRERAGAPVQCPLSSVCTYTASEPYNWVLMAVVIVRRQKSGALWSAPTSNPTHQRRPAQGGRNCCTSRHNPRTRRGGTGRTGSRRRRHRRCCSRPAAIWAGPACRPARRPAPTPSWTVSELKVQSTDYCRQMLTARNAGFLGHIHRY